MKDNEFDRKLYIKVGKFGQPILILLLFLYPGVKDFLDTPFASLTPGKLLGGIIGLGFLILLEMKLLNKLRDGGDEESYEYWGQATLVILSIPLLIWIFFFKESFDMFWKNPIGEFLSYLILICLVIYGLYLGIQTVGLKIKQHGRKGTAKEYLRNTISISKRFGYLTLISIGIAVTLTLVISVLALIFQK
ncbi:hypothetical protein HY404_03045 [Candidatus Microgenomates bacterium]|nr:hypothetical protein [Candidatus Microgenomates bacterium]